jgi:hypothetical protein
MGFGVFMDIWSMCPPLSDIPRLREAQKTRLCFGGTAPGSRKSGCFVAEALPLAKIIFANQSWWLPLHVTAAWFGGSLWGVLAPRRWGLCLKGTVIERLGMGLGTLIKKISSYIWKFRCMGSGAKSYMRKGFILYEEMRKFFPNMRRSLVIYDMTLHPIPLNFLIFFFISVL